MYMPLWYLDIQLSNKYELFLQLTCNITYRLNLIQL